jgi:hypothetical protein
MNRTQLAAASIGLAAISAGAFFALDGPRITLTNAAVRIDYPWPYGAGALAVAVGLALVAAAVPRRAARLVLGLLALAVFLASIERLAYHLDTDEAGLVSYRLTGRTSVRWAQVSRVESGPSIVVVWGFGDTQIRVDTSGFKPEQRAILDRVIARRVREGKPDK